MTPINQGIILGIDVSKSKLDIYEYPSSLYYEIKNQKKAIRGFFKCYLSKGMKIDKIILESTGGYEKLCVEAGSEMNFPIHIAHASQVYHFARSKKLLAKTDRIDAKVLAIFGLQEEIKPSVVKNKEEGEMQSLLRRKQQLTELLKEEKMRLSGPLCVGEMGRSVKRMLKIYEREIELIKQKLKDKINEDEQRKEKVERLKTCKGIGEGTAILLVVGLPELGRCSQREIASLVGLAPINRDSGQKQGYRSIRGGRFEVRKGLYIATLTAIRFNRKMKLIYEHLLKQGKPAKIAIVAVMRRLLITLNALLKKNEDWGDVIQNAS